MTLVLFTFLLIVWKPLTLIIHTCACTCLCIDPLYHFDPSIDWPLDLHCIYTSHFWHTSIHIILIANLYGQSYWSRSISEDRPYLRFFNYGTFGHNNLLAGNHELSGSRTLLLYILTVVLTTWIISHVVIQLITNVGRILNVTLINWTSVGIWCFNIIMFNFDFELPSNSISHWQRYTRTFTLPFIWHFDFQSTQCHNIGFIL